MSCIFNLELEQEEEIAFGFLTLLAKYNKCELLPFGSSQNARRWLRRVFRRDSNVDLQLNLEVIEPELIIYLFYNTQTYIFQLFLWHRSKLINTGVNENTVSS